MKTKEIIREAMSSQEAFMRDQLTRPRFHIKDEHGRTYIQVGNKRAIQAAKRMLKAGEVADVVDKSHLTGQGTEFGGRAYFNPFTKSWGNHYKRRMEPLAWVYLLNNITEANYRCEGSNYIMNAGPELGKSLNIKQIDGFTVELDCIKCRKRIKAKKQLRTGKWKIYPHNRAEQMTEDDKTEDDTVDKIEGKPVQFKGHLCYAVKEKFYIKAGAYEHKWREGWSLKDKKGRYVYSSDPGSPRTSHEYQKIRFPTLKSLLARLKDEES